MSDTQKEKEELIEMFGIHFEKFHHMPPLGARIFATIILDACGKGITFEDLVERMAASKSSVSTNVNLLLSLGKITYYTLPGDRKKYFKPSPFSERFSNYMKMIEFEKMIVDRMLAYREKTAMCVAEKGDLEKTKAYKEHILQMEELLTNTINKFKEIENNNK
ncbi:GbsR/MarR family transcriptional regulator [Flavobacterium sp.]|uniref:GbsR/MarR family transcriptional regulator n=1 Tax=Flavobacterium sp. TaxID=239 RepID=UPI0040331CF8